MSKVIIRNGRAVGIQAIEGGSARTYSANREVIVAAGAFGSPKLLQLSGIGDPEDLAAAGIDTVHALPGVGKNLHDHCDVDIVYELRDYHSLDRFNQVRPATVLAGVEYLAFRSGPFASTLVEAGGFSYANQDEKTPDLQFHFLPGRRGSGTGAAGAEARIRGHAELVLPAARSRGTVRVLPQLTPVAPLIDPNSSPTTTTGDGHRRGAAEPADHGAVIDGGVRQDGAHRGRSRVQTRDEYVNFVRSFGRTSYHPVGTCAMGPRMSPSSRRG